MSHSLSPLPEAGLSSTGSQVERWIEQAKAGSRTAMGRVLDGARKYLLLVANRALDEGLKSKVGASDLVQDTFVDAQRDFGQFRGATEEELYAWLIGILAHRLANNARRYRGAQKRNVDRELPAAAVEAAFAQLRDEALTPQAATLAREEETRIRAALEQMPEPWRSVLVERTWERKSFAEIGAARDCSAEAARKLWARAVQELQKIHGRQK